MGIFVSKTIGLDASVTNYVNSYNYISSICRPIYFLENGADELFVGWQLIYKNLNLGG